jgi:hypothetical protein
MVSLISDILVKRGERCCWRLMVKCPGHGDDGGSTAPQQGHSQSKWSVLAVSVSSQLTWLHACLRAYTPDLSGPNSSLHSVQNEHPPPFSSVSIARCMARSCIHRNLWTHPNDGQTIRPSVSGLFRIDLVLIKRKTEYL